MKKCMMMAAVLLGLALPSLAEGEKELNVLYVDGTEHVMRLPDIDRIELSAGTVNIVASAGTTTHRMSDIDKIEFRDGATAITQLKNQEKTDVTIRTNGYGIEVAGLADGDDVAVYTQNGMLVGKAKSVGGSANIDASGYADGIYVVKAGEHSLKMVKK